MLSTLMMTTKLSIVVHLLLMECHGSNIPAVEHLSWQRDITGTDHQRIRSLSALRVSDGRRQMQGLTVDGNVHEYGITIHPCLYLTPVNGRLHTNTIVLDLGSNLVAAAFPLLELLHLALTVRPLERIRQRAALTKVVVTRHRRSLEILSCVLFSIHQRNVLLRINRHHGHTCHCDSNCSFQHNNIDFF